MAKGYNDLPTSAVTYSKSCGSTISMCLNDSDFLLINEIFEVPKLIHRVLIHRVVQRFRCV